MIKKYKIIRIDSFIKDYLNETITYVNPVELKIYTDKMYYTIDGSFPLFFKNREITFFTDDNCIIIYKNNTLSIISEIILNEKK